MHIKHCLILAMKFCHMRIIFAYTQAFPNKEVVINAWDLAGVTVNEDEDNVKLSDLKIVEHDGQKGLFTLKEELLIGPLKLKKKDIIILF